MTKHVKRIVVLMVSMVILLSGVWSVSAQTITVTNSYANCRSQAGANNTYMGRVYAGEKYELLGTASAPNGVKWYKIKKNNKQVFICAAFAKVNGSSSSNSSGSVANSSGKTLRITQSCNVRSAAGQNNRLLGRAGYGSTYKVLGQGNAPNGKLWYKIQYNASTIGWVCSAFVKISSTGTSQPSSSNSNSSPYKLTSEERRLVERCVTTEAGGEPYEGQMAVAQTILNRAMRNKQTVLEVIKAPGQFAYQSNRATTQSVKNAVSAVFDGGKTVISSDVIYFCAPKIMSTSQYNKWRNGKIFVKKIGNHEFYRKA